MGFFDKLIGGGVKSLTDGIGDAIDRFVETPDEKRAWETLKAKMTHDSVGWQAEINKVEAGHRNIFVAGWRPAIGWVCAFSLAWGWILKPVLESVLIMFGKEITLPGIEVQQAIGLVMAMLGMAGIRSYDKKQGVSS